ncbi:MAG: response regulator, partial [Myxococcota bacterium]|nr:response regulator [Myxococcota bacterium]
AVILGNVALLDGGAGGEADRAARVRRIRAAARHAQGLTEQMLTYAGRSVGKLLPLDLSGLVRETEDLLRAAVAAPVRLELELAEGLPSVAADATQLRQVLLNLVTNASEALGAEGGTIRVRTALRRADPTWLADAFGSADRQEGPWVELEVADDGPGIDEAVRRRIFEPFYSTKRSGRGLGLASVLGIASAHRGLVVLESAPGEGTRFHLLVPPDTRVRREEPRSPAAPPRALGAAATVLVVDDEDAVREVAQVFLERAGFRVVAASGGREAVARLAEDPSIDAVVLDLAMPDLSGPETLRLLREARPGIPVVIASGYGRDLAAERLGEAGVAFVAKPYEPEALVSALDEAMREVGDDLRLGPAPR